MSHAKASERDDGTGTGSDGDERSGRPKAMNDLDFLRGLLRIRRFEEAAMSLTDETPGVNHYSIGLESSSVAIAQAREKGDIVLPTHRCHGPLVALGDDLSDLLSEILGRDRGCQRGRAGTLHLANPGLGVPHTTAMVAGGLAIAVGIGYAHKVRRTRSVVFCMLGDGALGEGVCYEALNQANLLSVRVLFLCDNNGAAGDQEGSDSRAARSLLAVPQALGVETSRVDGRDVGATVEAVRSLTASVRRTSAPGFLEVHSGAWPGNETFVPRDVPETDLSDAVGTLADLWRGQDDPVLAEARRLLRTGVTLEALVALDAGIKEEVDAARSAALAAPYPTSELIAHQVWAP